MIHLQSGGSLTGQCTCSLGTDEERMRHPNPNVCGFVELPCRVHQWQALKPGKTNEELNREVLTELLHYLKSERRNENGSAQ